MRTQTTGATNAARVSRKRDSVNRPGADRSTPDTEPDTLSILKSIFSELSPVLVKDKPSVLIDGARVSLQLTRLQWDTAFCEIERRYLARAPRAKRLLASDYKQAALLLKKRLDLDQRRKQQAYDASDMPDSFSDITEPESTLIDVPGTLAAIEPGKAIYLRTRQDRARLSHTWCPTVTDHVFFEDARPDLRHEYTVCIAGEEAQVFSNGEIESGEAWSRFTNITGTDGRANRDMLSNVVKFVAKDAPVTRGYATVGWHTLPSGQWAYLLEDGRGLDGAAYRVQGTPQTYLDYGRQRMPDLPLPDQALAESDQFWQWVYAASPKGHQALAIAKQFRAYLNDILDSLTTFVLYSKREGRAASRLGKTTIELFSHNLSFRTLYTDSPHASFTGTPGSIEKKIARQQSANCLIDDLNFPPSARLKDIEDKAHILEMIVRAVANNTEARSRMRKNLQLAESNRFQTLPGITGEKLPPVLSSLERRMITIPIDVGDIYLDDYRAGEETNAARLLRIGHMALHRIEQARTENADHLRYTLSQTEKDYERRLREGLYALLARPVSQVCDGLPAVYARLLTGMYALGRYAYDEATGDTWVDRLYPFVLTFLAQQVNRMEGFISQDDSGSLASLIHLIRDEVATNRPIRGTHYRFVDRTSRLCPDVTITYLNDAGAPVDYHPDCQMWGWPESGNDKGRADYAVLAYTDTNRHGDPVFYPTENFYTEIMKRAAEPNYEEYRAFQTKSAILDALVNEGWIARRDNDRAYRVQVRLPGISGKKHRELRLTRYLELPDTEPDTETVTGSFS